MYDNDTRILMVSEQLRHNIRGEPEQAPHKHEVCAVGLSVCRSVLTFLTQKYTRAVLIYEYLQLLIAAFKAYRKNFGSKKFGENTTEMLAKTTCSHTLSIINTTHYLEKCLNSKYGKMNLSIFQDLSYHVLKHVALCFQ